MMDNIKMNVIVVGLGSMGKRRIRLIKQEFPLMQIVGVDNNKTRCEDVSREYSLATFSSIEEACVTNKPQCAFICTPPLSHQKLIAMFLDKGIHVFTELNLVKDGYEELINRNKKDIFLFLSSTLLYREDVKYIINSFKNKKANYIYHVGQYLKDWHPWEDFKDFFVGDIRSNGCRELLAIELPWLTKAFGDIEEVDVQKYNLSDLDLGYPDTFNLIIKHHSGAQGLVCIDVVSRLPRRNLEVFNEENQLFWEGTPNSLKIYDVQEKILKEIKTYEKVENNKNYSANIIENAYEEEIKAFFTMINDEESEIHHTIEDDIKILTWIDFIEYGEKK